MSGLDGTTANATGRAARTATLVDDGAAITVTVGAAVLFEYRYRSSMPIRESPRPFLHPLRSLGGVTITDDAPLDHPWHHGLSIALPVVGEENFWGGPTFVRGEGYVQLPNNGSQQHLGFDEVSTADGRLVIRESLRWSSESGALVLREARELTVDVDESAGAWTLGIASSLSNATARVLQFGSPTTKGRENAGYGGWFLRAAPLFGNAEVVAPQSGGGGGTGDELRGLRAEWMALAVAGDRPVSVLIADHSPARPLATEWFVRVEEYPALCPAPFFSTEVAVEPGASLDLRYAVVIADGHFDHDNVRPPIERMPQ